MREHTPTSSPAKGIKHERLDAAAGAGNGEEAERAEDALLGTTAPGASSPGGAVQRKERKRGSFQVKKLRKHINF